MAVPVMIAAAVVSAYGAYEQGEANKGQAQYQAGVARNNQIISAQNATAATARGEAMVQTKEQQTAQTEGSYRARAGAGTDLTTGTPNLVQGDIAGLGELDALTIRNNAARESYGYKVAGQAFGSQAEALDVGAKNAQTAGELGAFSSIVGGASSVSDKWSKLNSAGANPWSAWST